MALNRLFNRFKALKTHLYCSDDIKMSSRKSIKLTIILKIIKIDLLAVLYIIKKSCGFMRKCCIKKLSF